MKRVVFLLLISFVSLHNVSASTLSSGIIIPSNLTIVQHGVNSNLGPWLITDSFLSGLVTISDEPITTFTIFAPVPTLTISPPAATLTSCEGSSPSSTTFNVTTLNLARGFTISVTTDFEISRTLSGIYEADLNLARTITNVTCFIRLKSTASTGTITGIITVSSNGATTVTTTVSGTVNALPTINISGATTNVDLVSLTASGGSSYSWSGGTLTNTASNTFDASGLYSLSVTDANNCISSTLLNIKVEHWGLSRNGEKTLDSIRQINRYGQINSLYPISPQGKITSYRLNVSVGSRYGGGIVFYVTDDGTHGLIAAESDQSAGITWNNVTPTITGATATAIGTGLANTNAIILSQGNTGSYAAKLCADYSITANDVVYDDWYLPSQDELNQLYLSGIPTNLNFGFRVGGYWSSSELRLNGAWAQKIRSDNSSTNNAKDNTINNVRAIRSF